jgi:NADPH-dependent 2,4-dienoyl-CoA reductase/sulfur reductase-like enzyme
MKIVIIGNSIGGFSALKEIRKYDKNSEITILSRERYDYYSPVVLPYYIDGRLSLENLFSKDINLYLKDNARVILNEEVKYIDSHKKTIETEKHTFQYDKLIIASGASPRKLNIKGAEKSYVLRTYEDAEKIKKIRSKNIIIIGAGPVGIETAISLHKLGKKIIILEMMDYILSTIFSKNVSKYIERLLEDLGIEIYKNQKVLEISEKPVKGVRTNERFFKGNAVIMAVGVKPNIDFVDESIKIGKYGGILVNEYMNTSNPDIFAVGDCIELKNSIENIITPVQVWPNAFETGKIAGANIVGKIEKYEGGMRINALNVLNNVFFSVGNVWQEDNKIQYINDNIQEIYYIKDGKIIGVEIMGDVKWGGLIKRFLIAKKTIGSSFKGTQEIKNILLPQKL